MIINKVEIINKTKLGIINQLNGRLKYGLNIPSNNESGKENTKVLIKASTISKIKNGAINLAYFCLIKEPSAIENAA